MAPELVKAGLAWRTFLNVDWEVTMINTPVLRGQTIHAGLIWTDPAMMIEHFHDLVENTSARRNAQIDRRIHEGPPDQELTG
ncbi:MAG: hypothetical protein ACK5JT_02920 [Hyphomicrobiaceae bacterium]